MATDAEQTVLDLERRFWTEGGGDPVFWSRHFADDGLVALPMAIMDKAETVAAMEQARPWAGVTFDDTRFVHIADTAIAVAYRATARREGDPADYTAIISSVYARRDGRWLLVFHQQTPTA